MLHCFSALHWSASCFLPSLAQICSDPICSAALLPCISLLCSTLQQSFCSAPLLLSSALINQMLFSTRSGSDPICSAALLSVDLCSAPLPRNLSLLFSLIISHSRQQSTLLSCSSALLSVDILFVPLSGDLSDLPFSVRISLLSAALLLSSMQWPAFLFSPLSLSRLLLHFFYIFRANCKFSITILCNEFYSSSLNY